MRGGNPPRILFFRENFNSKSSFLMLMFFMIGRH